jgi:hypothetical protein
LAGAGIAGSAFASSYYVWDDWGGTYHDANKTLNNRDDDLMCWAAAASNVLDWTGWGNVPGNGFTSQDDIFDHFQAHWTDQAGIMSFGWHWWFYGTNIAEGWAGWSQVDQAGGGNFFASDSFFNHYHSETMDENAMAAVDSFLHAGFGTTIAIYGPGGHALSVWGYEFDAGEYQGLWVTDSDDDMSSNDPSDELVYYDVLFEDGKWFLQGYGNNDWYIGEVQALAQAPAESTQTESQRSVGDGDATPIPEPTTLLLLVTGVAGLAVVTRCVK